MAGISQVPKESRKDGERPFVPNSELSPEAMKALEILAAGAFYGQVGSVKVTATPALGEGELPVVISATDYESHGGISILVKPDGVSVMTGTREQLGEFFQVMNGYEPAAA